MRWEERVREAIARARTFNDLWYIEDKVYSSPHRPNYKTKAGRELRDTLIEEINRKRDQLVDTNPPF